MRLPALLLLGLIAGPLSAQKATTAAESPSVTLPPELDRVLRDYEKNWTGKNPPGLSELFAEDGFALMSGTTGARGRPAIAKIYAGAGGELKLRALAYSAEGNTGYIIGAYGYGAGSQDTGKFVLALQKVGGKWLIAADIDNGNRR
ncbi:MAG TPA: nuclear transport factor 2 family protein [Gemmatimonadales bacterium]|nr:nuclear transport factor 2 family protein [Gemmatimonadales bacterium]